MEGKLCKFRQPDKWCQRRGKFLDEGLEALKGVRANRVALGRAFGEEARKMQIP